MDNRLGSQHNDCMKVCKHVRYTGRVQGVGFRYIVQRLAESSPVTGYVRNLPDGTVEVVAEGTAEAMDAFLTAIARRMAHYIAGSEVREDPCGGHDDFRIRF
jgi:acylphosphatase